MFQSEEGHPTDAHAGGWTPSAEILSRTWALLLVVALLTTGCVTLAPPPGGGSAQGPRVLSSSRETTAGTPPLQSTASVEPTDAGEHGRPRRRRSARGLGLDIALASTAASEGPRTCGGQAVPPGWPDFSSSAEALLAPFLACSSPAEFVALQEGVDMPRLVEALDEWSAVRLGALGPVREDAAHLLQRKRATFLVTATERYGLSHAEVFALFVLHSSHDDEVDEVLHLLARDKQLGQTLGLMPSGREELEARGLSLARYPDRTEKAGDVLRGLGHAARDMLSSSLGSDGARYTELAARRAQLPPPYQHALHEVERELALRHFAPDSVAVGTFDAMTFGVPLGFYSLAVGTGHGAYSLSQGQYEQATRELAPALLVGALYARGKGPRALSEARGGPGSALGGVRGLGLPEQRWAALAEVVRRLESRLGMDGLRELARDIQASREAGRFVAVGGVDAALALREAGGNVARAQAMMSKARPEATGSSAGRHGAAQGSGAAATVMDEAARPAPRKARATESPGALASLVDKEAGLTLEVVEAKLAAVELESAGPRLPRDVAVLEKQRPSLDAPPPEARDNPRWHEYVDYYDRRLGELAEGRAAKGPLRWEAYASMWRGFSRGLAFERLMVTLLKADAQLPRAQRRFLGDFDRPRVETYVGVMKPETGLRFADVLVIEEGELAGRPRRVETLSFKSRNLSGLKRGALEAQI